MGISGKGGLGGHLVRLRLDVEEFVDRPNLPSSPYETSLRVRHLAETIDMLRLEQAKLVGVLIDVGWARDDGVTTPAEWLRHEAKMSKRDASDVVAVAERLSELPQGQTAIRSATVGFGHLVQMARTASFIGRHQTGKFDELPLLVRAMKESVSRFHFTCLKLRHAQDPEGVVDAEVKAVEMRELDFNQMDDGTTYINLLLDTPTARIIELDTRKRAERLGPDDTRSFARRQADAMVDRLLGDGGMSVEITLSGTPDTFMGVQGAPAAELEHCDPVSGEMFRRLGCSASFTKILLDDRLIPVAATTSRRMPTARER